MNKSILAVLFLFCITVSHSQVIFKVDNNSDNKAVLSYLAGEKITFLDTITSNIKREFRFNLNGNHPGIYRLGFNNNQSLNSRAQTKWIDFVYDNEEIEIEIDLEYIPDIINVLKSESNKIYYKFLILNKDYKTKTELLQLILARYPEEDDYYQLTKQKLIQVQEEYLYFVNVTAQVNPESFIARYVRSSQLPVIEMETHTDKQLDYLKTHALDNVNFYDDGLIYSDAFANKSIEYLTYYRNPQFPLELLEKEFMSAIDTILSKAKVNEIVNTHIVEYLLDGFKKFGFDNVIDYIVESYVIKDDLCIDQKLSNTLERRIQQASNFKKGDIVPDIILPDSSGSLVDLSKINAEKTLIIFYASWCTHCQALLPKIYELYNSQEEKKLEVVAISIDTSRVDWLQFVRTNNLNWINVSDLEGWDGRSTKDYFIFATPTMFLIDNRLKLIAKPSSIEELGNWF